jgi:hypothetical protein
MKLTKEDVERFKTKTKKNKKTGCLEWTASTSSNGYGQFYVKSDKLASHRVAWTIANGPIPKGTCFHGTCVLHKCDNPSCVRVSHLFLGSMKDNSIDMVNKGRNRDIRGIKNDMAKFSEADVLEIRRQWSLHIPRVEDGYMQKDIAERFNTCQQVISNIVIRKRWKHI